MKNKELIEELKNLDPELEVKGKTLEIFGATVIDGEEGRYVTL